ncbi:WD40 repeat-like protein [Rhizoclosmatium globosum]|uniref:Cilia- and flagella-associated protein 251 n=1 Tax=Rhizoclosmatium globosum TaxID=329046 RepID=A0A1Y2CVR3_9FUNG|nr:WD40 repeat-like protein [Rhizoclosmatium globosum]|eukprot:ORY51113.1 WD40 repeat-like protein [Rhizoclosmatium globosum]
MDQKHVLNLSWTFGLNRNIVGGVFTLADGPNRKILFYASSHTGVLFDWIEGKQQVLQGHIKSHIEYKKCNEISATAVTSNKRWVVTADKGVSPVLIVWDTMPHMIHQHLAKLVPGSPAGPPLLNAVPIKTIFEIHSGTGVVACEFSKDMKYLATLGAEEKQTIQIWDWSAETDTPLCKLEIEGEPQRTLKINPEDSFEIMTNGSETVNFFIWDKDGSIVKNVPLLASKDFLHTPAKFTYSMFIPTKHQAITATVDGDVIIWANHSLNNLSMDLGKGKYACVKFMKLHQSAINYVTTIGDQYVVTGGEEGSIKIFDLQLRLIIWFEKLKAGPITSISFCSSFTKPIDSRDSIVPDLNIPELVLCTKHSRVLLLSKQDLRNVKTPPVKARIGSADKNGEVLGVTEEGPDVHVLHETQYQSVHGLAAHPKLPRFVVGGYSGLLQIWDYSAKNVVVSRLFEIVHVDEDPHTPLTKKKKPVVEHLKIESIAFSADGEFGGFENGTLRILDANTLLEIDGQRSVTGDIMTPYYIVAKDHPENDFGCRVTNVAFSACGKFFAASDSQFAVTLFKKETRIGPKKNIDGVGRAVEKLASGEKYTVWMQIGKCKAHYKDIICDSHVHSPTALEPTRVRLLSVSTDRHCAEYDTDTSTITSGIKLISLKRIEQTSRPLAATWHPSLSLTNKPPQPESHNPALPNKDEIASISADTFILTCNSDYKIRLHNSNTQLCRKTVLGPTFGGNLNSLVIMPDIGTTDSFNYVAYSTHEKVVGLTKMPFDGNPHKFMGLIAHPCQVSKIASTFDGCFLLTAGLQDATVHMWSVNPTALDTQIAIGGKELEPFLDMLDESGAGETGAFYREMEDYFYYAQLRSQGEDAATTRLIQDTVGIMYINHRPVFDHSEEDLLAALKYAVKLTPGLTDEKRDSIKTINSETTVTKDGLYSLLQQYGEVMTKEDLQTSFRAMLLNDPVYNGTLPEKFTGRQFIEELLGLQPTVVNGAAPASEK